MPGVVGQTEDNATATLRSKGFDVDVVTKTVPAGDPNVGRVIAQSPASGATADSGSTVRITVGVAAATTPRRPAPPRPPPVPDMSRVRGAAPIAVGLLGAVLLVGLLGFSSTLNPIDAVLGRGAVVTVPDLQGRPRPGAEADVRSQGLEPVVRSSYSLTGRRGTVIGQDPAPGSRVREGSTVTVVISRGANRVAMPDAVGKPLVDATGPLEEADVKLTIERVPSETVAAGAGHQPGARSRRAAHGGGLGFVRGVGGPGRPGRPGGGGRRPGRGGVPGRPGRAGDLRGGPDRRSRRAGRSGDPDRATGGHRGAAGHRAQGVRVGRPAPGGTPRRSSARPPTRPRERSRPRGSSPT